MLKWLKLEFFILQGFKFLQENSIFFLKSVKFMLINFLETKKGTLKVPFLTGFTP